MNRTLTLQALALVLGLASTTGCTSYLGPYEDRPVPARSLEARNGARIELRDGALSLHTGRADAAGAYGVDLVQDDSGVSVGARLRADAELAPGDRILAARPTEACVPGSRWQPVHAVSDLAGYLCGLGWVELELRVQRGGAEVVLTSKPRDDARPLAIATTRFSSETGPTRFDVALPRLMGAEVSPLADWPEALRPTHASRGETTELLVTRVAQDSPAAIAGLLPGDVVVDSAFREDGATTAGHDRLHDVKSVEWLAIVRGADGRERGIEARRSTQPWDVWIPLLFSWQTDGVRSHFGLGPTDALFHWSSRPQWSDATSSPERVSRWSVLTMLQSERVTRPGGVSSHTSFQPVVDFARWFYYDEWKNGTSGDMDHSHVNDMMDRDGR